MFYGQKKYVCMSVLAQLRKQEEETEFKQISLFE